MQDLIKQEQFEIEVLDALNSAKLLPGLAFGGGTMLRLCFGLERFSVDLDFWAIKGKERKGLFLQIKKSLLSLYRVTDAANKFYTMLFEIRSSRYPRSLKIEIRKEPRDVKTAPSIAFSRFSNTQVLLKALTLPEMMEAKLNALITRKEIRDAFDIEFMLRKGILLEAPEAVLEKALKVIEAFKKNDYAVKLGSLLEESKRKYYMSENFKILKSAIKSKLPLS